MKDNSLTKYKHAVIATDIVIFTIKDDQLMVLLIEMKKPPYTEYWACPGGLIQIDESVDAAAARVLKEKSGVRGVYLEQLHTFGDVDRDPFGRVVSVAYYALVPADDLELKTTEEYKDVSWFSVKKLPLLAYDHNDVIGLAVQTLRSKLETTNIVYSLLSKEFSLSDLQSIYEIILDRKLDKRNFRRKILDLNLVKKSKTKRWGQPNRPAQLYNFSKRKLEEVAVL